uniref:HDC10249 n=1 Tax=Drosophila melanogaster TaxID=7227 RepID=Q6IL66_DROME|nr:TPA_inf: HDC10249 [Drosophila melanogaster]
MGQQRRRVTTTLAGNNKHNWPRLPPVCVTNSLASTPAGQACMMTIHAKKLTSLRQMGERPAMSTDNDDDDDDDGEDDGKNAAVADFAFAVAAALKLLLLLRCLCKF